MQKELIMTARAKIYNFLNRYLHKINLENIIIGICFLILAVKFYSVAGRFLDTDEEYYFYITSAISKGVNIYAELNFFYPPIPWYLCSVFFRLFHNLYQSLLTIRLLIISLSLLSFFLIFDMLKRLRASWFVIPVTIFILYSMQFSLKLMEYRSDNVLFFVLILQGYLMFLMSQYTAFSPLKIAAVIFLAFLSFHINQKAIIIELPLLFAFCVCFFNDLRRFVLIYKKALLFFGAIIIVCLIFSRNYHQFFCQSYIYGPIMLNQFSKISPSASFVNNLNLLIPFIKDNLAFWITGLISSIVLLLALKNNKNYLVPLMFLAGAVVLVLIAPFPFIHYQAYCVWAVLFSLPYLISICINSWPHRKILLFVIFFLLAASGALTFQRYEFPFQNLKGYATEIDRIRGIIGENKLASFGGSSINIESDFPLWSGELQFVYGTKALQTNTARTTLKDKATKFVFIDPRENIKKALYGEDGYFIKANYQKCHGLPLMIASKWAYLGPGQRTINIEIAGKFKVMPFSNISNSITLDNYKLKSFQTLYLKQGPHSIKSALPAALLIEFDSAKINSESFDNLNGSKYEFMPLNQDFSGKFELLGAIKYEKSGKAFYRFFWKALSDINDGLMAFHHFYGSGGNYINGINVDPTDGWYDIRALKSGEVISYEFSVDLNKEYKSMDIGWYYEQDWSRRIPCGAGTFYRMYI